MKSYFLSYIDANSILYKRKRIKRYTTLPRYFLLLYFPIDEFFLIYLRMLEKNKEKKKNREQRFEAS